MTIYLQYTHKKEIEVTTLSTFSKRVGLSKKEYKKIKKQLKNGKTELYLSNRSPVLLSRGLIK